MLRCTAVASACNLFVLGRAEYATLPFMGRSDTELDMEHAKIIRQPGGRFAVQDNQSRQGVLVNNVRIHGSRMLDDGDWLAGIYGLLKGESEIQKDLCFLYKIHQ